MPRPGGSWADATGRTTRFLANEPTRRRLLDLAASVEATGDGWRFDLDPRPTSEWSNWTIGGLRRWEDVYHQPLDLDRFGVLPGSVLTMTCPHRSLGSTTDTYPIGPSHLS